jgi:hypothetical protein
MIVQTIFFAFAAAQQLNQAQHASLMAFFDGLGNHLLHMRAK